MMFAFIDSNYVLLVFFITISLDKLMMIQAIYYVSSRPQEL